MVDGLLVAAVADPVRYKGTFNWHGEVLILYRHAPSEGQAFNFMTRALADQLAVHIGVVRGWFNGQQDNYKIERT